MIGAPPRRESIRIRSAPIATARTSGSCTVRRGAAAAGRPRTDVVAAEPLPAPGSAGVREAEDQRRDPLQVDENHLHRQLALPRPGHEQAAVPRPVEGEPEEVAVGALEEVDRHQQLAAEQLRRLRERDDLLAERQRRAPRGEHRAALAELEPEAGAERLGLELPAETADHRQQRDERPSGRRRPAERRAPAVDHQHAARLRRERRRGLLPDARGGDEEGEEERQREATTGRKAHVAGG